MSSVSYKVRSVRGASRRCPARNWPCDVKPGDGEGDVGIDVQVVVEANRTRDSSEREGERERERAHAKEAAETERTEMC